MKAYRVNTPRSHRWPKVALFLGVAVLLTSLAAYLGIRSLYSSNLRAVDEDATDSIVFVIENGDTVEVIAKRLEQEELIRSAWAFRQYVRAKQLDDSFIAGTYSLKQSYDVEVIVSYLVEGRVDEELFTILPGKRLSQIRQAFIDEGFDEEAVEVALQASRYDGHPALDGKPVGASLEGYLYPDSFQRIAETTPETIIRQSLDEMADALSPEVRAGIEAQGLSLYQGLIVASIVEKEVSANNPEDRPRVAQVFIKRLRIGMPLQSNATDNLPAEYDTYSIPALPPDPISNVTISSLRAVANPSATDYVFFVAGRDCVTRFSQTEDQHENLKQQFGIAKPEDRCT